MKNTKDKIIVWLENLCNIAFYAAGLIGLLFAIFMWLNPSFIGNSATRVFHRIDCLSIEQMSSGNRVTLANLQDAYDKGYRACQNCAPEFGLHFVIHLFKRFFIWIAELIST